MAHLWTVNTGHNLGTYQESITQTIALPVVTGTTIKLISGKLPGGLRIENDSLIGTPFEVKRLRTFTFVLRAVKDQIQEDVTLSMKIEGADQPTWVTSEGPLPLGPNNRFYILDSSPVDFQLQVIDPDLPAGDSIEYFMGDNDGELPPGIELGRTTGKLTGVVEPILALEKRSDSGFFDTNVYGTFPFDFGVKSANGFESYYYDTTFYDYAVPTRSPKKLNRYYEFTVNASDGITIARRKFQIYLVGDDFLRTDNTIMQIGTGLFTADNTYLRAPVWLTPSDLGYRRANNYVTLFLDVYDPTSNQGIISFTVKDSNADGSPSALPPGMKIDSTTGEIAGRIPYQPAVTTEYKFTIEALRQLGSKDTTTTEPFANNIGVGQTWSGDDNIAFTDFADTLFNGLGANGWIVFNEVPVTEADSGDNKAYRSIEIIDKTVWTIENGRVTSTSNDKAVTKIERGSVDYLRGSFSGTIADIGFKTYDAFGATVANKVVTMSFYSFEKRTTSSVNPTVAKDKEFTVKLLGEIESAITWNTASTLGNLRANFVSTLNVSATSNVPNAVVLYTLDSGRLPPGLTLAIDGQLQGKVNQFGEPNKPGLTTIDKSTTETTFDGATTTIDRSYTFTVKAQDQFQFSATTRQFTITTTDPDDKLYSSISMVPMLKQTQRNAFRNFISDPTIFNPGSIYRPNDESFGLQPQIKMLAYAGIETKSIREFVSAVAKNHKRKKYKLGEVKKAIAKNPGSNDTVYEVIYVDVIDPAEPEVGKGKTALDFTTATQKNITTDQIQYSVTDDNTGLGTGQGFFELGLRGGGGNSPASSGSLAIFTRLGPISFNPGGSITVELQDGTIVSSQSIDSSISSDPFRLRPLTNTIKIDSDAIKISDSKDQRKYISNITNMRDRIRAVGSNLREFYPLWMRTAQIIGQAELGFTLAVPLCYCKPGEADNIILNINNSNFNFKQLDIEIERYNIDSTDGNSNEQYVPFANYQFNV
tara:strand:- start:1978 stop:4935 length:2958 start_codon:yes stop_codon:yes gene_type:complete